MFRRTIGSVRYACVLLSCLMTVQLTAQAGPPLICHPFETGGAQSLPWKNAAEWRGAKSDYALNRLVDDTLALLTPATPVIARMETLRRAAIYAVWAARDREVGRPVYGEQIAFNQKVADELLARLQARAKQNPKDALALFDAGYLRATYQQSGWQAGQQQAVDAYAQVRQAAEMSGDATMQFAAALATQDKAVQRAHLQKAATGATEGSLLARNLVKHFSNQGRNLAELRNNLGALQ